MKQAENHTKASAWIKKLQQKDGMCVLMLHIIWLVIKSFWEVEPGYMWWQIGTEWIPRLWVWAY